MKALAGVRTKLNQKNRHLMFATGCLKIREPISLFISHQLRASLMASVAS
jgi:hypothetical protein